MHIAQTSIIQNSTDCLECLERIKYFCDFQIKNNWS